MVESSVTAPPHLHYLYRPGSMISALRRGPNIQILKLPQGMLLMGVDTQFSGLQKEQG
jgi:hypothetical protein